MTYLRVSWGTLTCAHERTVEGRGAHRRLSRGDGVEEKVDVHPPAPLVLAVLAEAERLPHRQAHVAEHGRRRRLRHLRLQQPVA
eukprot:1185407-Prorocentrum_minimum.AAC.2